MVCNTGLFWIMNTNIGNDLVPPPDHLRTSTGDHAEASGEPTAVAETDRVMVKVDDSNPDLMTVEGHDAAPPAPPQQELGEYDRPFSIFTHNEKRTIVFCAGICAFFSPISSMIYFPSLPAIAKDLHVSNSLINFTITVYLVWYH